MIVGMVNFTYVITSSLAAHDRLSPLTEEIDSGNGSHRRQLECVWCQLCLLSLNRAASSEPRVASPAL